MKWQALWELHKLPVNFIPEIHKSETHHNSSISEETIIIVVGILSIVILGVSYYKKKIGSKFFSAKINISGSFFIANS